MRIRHRGTCSKSVMLEVASRRSGSGKNCMTDFTFFQTQTFLHLIEDKKHQLALLEKLKAEQQKTQKELEEAKQEICESKKQMEETMNEKRHEKERLSQEVQNLKLQTAQLVALRDQQLAQDVETAKKAGEEYKEKLQKIASDNTALTALMDEQSRLQQYVSRLRSESRELELQKEQQRKELAVGGGAAGTTSSPELALPRHAAHQPSSSAGDAGRGPPARIESRKNLPLSIGAGGVQRPPHAPGGTSDRPSVVGNKNSNKLVDAVGSKLEQFNRQNRETKEQLKQDVLMVEKASSSSGTATYVPAVVNNKDHPNYVNVKTAMRSSALPAAPAPALPAAVGSSSSSSSSRPPGAMVLPDPEKNQNKLPIAPPPSLNVAETKNSRSGAVSAGAVDVTKSSRKKDKLSAEQVGGSPAFSPEIVPANNADNNAGGVEDYPPTPIIDAGSPLQPLSTKVSEMAKMWEKKKQDKNSDLDQEIKSSSKKDIKEKKHIADGAAAAGGLLVQQEEGINKKAQQAVTGGDVVRSTKDPPPAPAATASSSSISGQQNLLAKLRGQTVTGLEKEKEKDAVPDPPEPPVPKKEFGEKIRPGSPTGTAAASKNKQDPPPINGSFGFGTEQRDKPSSSKHQLLRGTENTNQIRYGNHKENWLKTVGGAATGQQLQNTSSSSQPLVGGGTSASSQQKSSTAAMNRSAVFNTAAMMFGGGAGGAKFGGAASLLKGRKNNPTQLPNPSVAGNGFSSSASSAAAATSSFLSKASRARSPILASRQGGGKADFEMEPPGTRRGPHYCPKRRKIVFDAGEPAVGTTAGGAGASSSSQDAGALLSGAAAKVEEAKKTKLEVEQQGDGRARGPPPAVLPDEKRPEDADANAAGGSKKNKREDESFQPGVANVAPPEVMVNKAKQVNSEQVDPPLNKDRDPGKNADPAAPPASSSAADADPPIINPGDKRKDSKDDSKTKNKNPPPPGASTTSNNFLLEDIEVKPAEASRGGGVPLPSGKRGAGAAQTKKKRQAMLDDDSPPFVLEDNWHGSQNSVIRPPPMARHQVGGGGGGAASSSSTGGNTAAVLNRDTIAPGAAGANGRNNDDQPPTPILEDESSNMSFGQSLQKQGEIPGGANDDSNSRAQHQQQHKMRNKRNRNTGKDLQQILSDEENLEPKKPDEKSPSAASKLAKKEALNKKKCKYTLEDLKKRTVPEIKAILEACNLKTTGRKDELAKRVVANPDLYPPTFKTPNGKKPARPR